MGHPPHALPPAAQMRHHMPYDQTRDPSHGWRPNMRMMPPQQPPYMPGRTDTGSSQASMGSFNAWDAHPNPDAMSCMPPPQGMSMPPPQGMSMPPPQGMQMQNQGMQSPMHTPQGTPGDMMGIRPNQAMPHYMPR
eukprot:GHVO01009902.1.p1 GENE.GHVO01009902.1~~GHVO01009902.1.p1  ORF type:complete len:149 (+),score=52.19 GHVO01009902.1:43-447(+)